MSAGQSGVFDIYLAQAIREEMPQAKALEAKTAGLSLSHAILGRLAKRRDELEAVCIVAGCLQNLQSVQNLPREPANFSDNIRGVATFG